MEKSNCIQLLVPHGLGLRPTFFRTVFWRFLQRDIFYFGWKKLVKLLFKNPAFATLAIPDKKLRLNRNKTSEKNDWFLLVQKTIPPLPKIIRYNDSRIFSG